MKIRDLIPENDTSMFKLVDAVKRKEEIKNSYESRKIARVDPEDNEGVGVSTAWTDDMGFETALLDQNGCHPVERYQSWEDAVRGHFIWVEQAKIIETVIKLGYDSIVSNKVITLARVKLVIKSKDNGEKNYT
jgi:hypothetical protein